MVFICLKHRIIKWLTAFDTHVCDGLLVLCHELHPQCLFHFRERRVHMLLSLTLFCMTFHYVDQENQWEMLSSSLHSESTRNALQNQDMSAMRVKNNAGSIVFRNWKDPHVSHSNCQIVLTPFMREVSVLWCERRKLKLKLDQHAFHRHPTSQTDLQSSSFTFNPHVKMK